MFAERLQLALSLKIESLRLEVPGGDIKRFSCQITSYGFEAEVEFWMHLEVETDILWPLFKTNTLIEARLEIAGKDHVPKPAPRPLVLQGLVRHKRTLELVNDKVDDFPVLFRRYHITFADTAQVLWRQHRPSALFAEATMAEIIAAQCAPGITLEQDWPAVLDKVRPLVCFELGKEPDGPSFYDFLAWYLHREGGTLTYSTWENKYTIAEGRPEDPIPSLVDWKQIDRLEVVIPETPRHTIRVLNAIAESPTTEDVDQTDKVEGLRRDFLTRAPVAADATALKTVETARLKTIDHELALTWKEFPDITFRPGSMVTFTNHLGGKPLGNLYRVYELILSGDAVDPNPETDRAIEYTGYHLDLRASLELSDELTVRRPEFVAPNYPVTAQGRVVSEIGEDGDKTYQIYQDADTSLDVYKVMVPIWNKVIPVPFEPLLMPGHFYFPAYREQPVVVSLWLYRGEIHRFLDWGAGTRLPQTGQGDHLLLGKRRTDQTSIRHDYEDAKPVLTVERHHSVDDETLDEQVIRVEEGILTITVQEVDVSEASSEKFSVKPRVDAAQAELTAETEGAMTQMASAYQMASAGIAGQLAEAIDETKTALDDMEAEVSDKIGELRGEAEAALNEISAATAELSAQAEATIAELEGLL
jgi:hypothetical protein